MLDNPADDYDPNADAMELDEARRHRALEMAIEFHNNFSQKAEDKAVLATAIAYELFLKGSTP